MDEPFDDRQPQPGAAVTPVARQPAPVEFFEDPCQIGLFDTDTCIGNGEFEVAIFLTGRNLDLTMFSELHRVA